MLSSELMQHIGVDSLKESISERDDLLKVIRCLGMIFLLFCYLVFYQIAIWSTFWLKIVLPDNVSDLQDRIGSGFWMLGLYLLELNNVKLIVSGDKLEIENSMIISNHQSLIDYFVFPYLSILLIQRHEEEEEEEEEKEESKKDKASKSTKKIIRNQFESEYIIAKDYKSLLMPNVMYFTWYNIWKAPTFELFHKIMMSDENWELNPQIQYDLFKNYKQRAIKKVSEWLILFPEVNIFSEQNLKLENSMAERYYLPFFKNLLYPRYSNFANAVGGLYKSQFSRLYDVCIVYKRTPTDNNNNKEEEDQFKAPNLFEIFGLYKGNFTIYVNIKAKMLNRVPLKRNRLEKWLEKKWCKKEKLIESMKFELSK